MGAVGNKLRDRGARDFAITFATGAVLLLASLANFLTYNNYPYLRVDDALVVIAMLAVSAAMVPFYLGQRQWGRSILEGLLAAVYFDLNTDSIALAAAAGVAVTAFTWWRKSSLLPQMAIIGLVVLVGTIAGIAGRPSWVKTAEGDAIRKGSDSSAKPAIIHIILDEHLGLEGLSKEGAEGQRLRDELRSSYVASGFAVYGGAYSQHYHSANSIPFILNYGGALAKKVKKDGIEAGPTKHLQGLVDQGYRLTIFQSNYADFCTGAKFFECITYDSSSLRPTLAVSMRDLDRAELTIYKFLKLSDIFGAASDTWNIAGFLLRPIGISLPLYNFRSGNSSTVGTLESMKQLTQKLEIIRPGEAVFAHLLLPHHPYVVRRDCSYLPWAPWEGLKTAAPLEVKRRSYYEQIRCTSRKIDAIVKAVSQSPAGSSAVIIVHGDHGSRMSRIKADNQSSGNFDDSDMIPVFSTVFAVRAPGVQPGYFQERQPVSALLRDFAASGFRSAPHPKQPEVATVYLTDSEWKPARRVALPSSWTKENSQSAAHPGAH